MISRIKKRPLLIGTAVALAALALTFAFRGLPEEELLGESPEAKTSAESLALPFFGVFATWPTTFLGEPIFVQIPYHRGPPKKFIERIDFVFKTNVATLEIHGPKTIDAKLTRAMWRNCYSAWIKCRGAKKNLIQSLHPKVARNANFSWIRSNANENLQGLHAVLNDEKYRLDEYVLFDESGAATQLLLRTAQTAEGARAFDSWSEILTTLRTVPLGQFKTSAEWAGTEIARVRLSDLLKTKDASQRIAALARAQLTIASRLSVQPTQAEGFFHFGGVSHLLAIELIKAKPGTLKSQESFFQSAEPNLLAMQSYIRDFGARSREERNIEALIQDLSTHKKAGP